MGRRLLGILASASIVLGLSGGGVAARSGPLPVVIVASPHLTAWLETAQIDLGADDWSHWRIDNPNASIALEGVALTVTAPSGLALGGYVAYCAALQLQAGAADANGHRHSLTATNGVASAGGTCTIHAQWVAVQAGTFTITSNKVDASNSGPGNSATVTVKVIGPATPTPHPAAPTATVSPAASPSASETATASPAASPAATADASATAAASGPPAEPGSTTGGDSIPWIPILLLVVLASAVAAVIGGLATAGGLLFMQRRRSDPDLGPSAPDAPDTTASPVSQPSPRRRGKRPGSGP